MRALRCALALALLVLTSTPACAGGRGAVAPSWTRTAIGGDCELGGAVDLEAFESATKKDKSPASGALGSAASMLSYAPVPIPHGKRMAACLRLKPGSGDIASWIVIVSGVSRASTNALAARAGGTRLPKGGTVIGTKDGAGRLFVLDETLILASQSIEARLVTISSSDLSSGIDLPKGVLARFTVAGEAARRLASERRNEDFWDGLEEGSVELRMEDDHLRLVAHARYAGPPQAERSLGAVKSFWAALGESRRDRDEQKAIELAKAFTKLDVKVAGRDVDATLTLLHADEADKNAPTPPAHVRPVSPAQYESRCPRGQRLDLDRRTCVEVP